MYWLFLGGDAQECLWGEHLLSAGHHAVRNSAVLSSYSRLVFFVVINNPTSIDKSQDIVRQKKNRALDRYKSLAVCYVDLLCFFHL